MVQKLVGVRAAHAVQDLGFHETSTDANGGALTYALLFEAGGIVGAEQVLALMNFTGKP